jgi:hypothetical protein
MFQENPFNPENSKERIAERTSEHIKEHTKEHSKEQGTKSPKKRCPNGYRKDKHGNCKKIIDDYDERMFRENPFNPENTPPKSALTKPTVAAKAKAVSPKRKSPFLMRNLRKVAASKKPRKTPLLHFEAENSDSESVGSDDVSEDSSESNLSDFIDRDDDVKDDSEYREELDKFKASQGKLKRIFQSSS